MKSKFMTGMMAVVTAATIGFSPITAFAMTGVESECICDIKCDEDNVNEECPVCKDDYTLCQGEEVEVIEEEPMGPLTPDGNLTLVDDYGSLEAGGKQFITVVTKAGNYFYIIIDRDDSGDETVHFLNMVDESDLLSLMDDEEAEAYINSITEEETEPEEEEVVETEETTEESEETPKKSLNANAIMALMFLAGIGIVGGYVFFKKSKMKDTKKSSVDPDQDYDEDEDYLEDLISEDDVDEDFAEDYEEPEAEAETTEDEE